MVPMTGGKLTRTAGSEDRKLRGSQIMDVGG